MKHRLAVLATLAVLAACGETPTNPTESVAPATRKLAADLAPTTQVFTSGAQVLTWDAIPEPTTSDSYWTTQTCVATPKVGLTAAWQNPHNAFVVGGHVWFNWFAAESWFFTAPWINAWNSLSSSGSGSNGPGYHNWTKYETAVQGNGDFVIRLLADNCSWIYLDGNLVGVQGGDLKKNAYGLSLNGSHTLSFIIFDGGGSAGGMYKLETTNSPPPPLNTDLDNDGHENSEDDFPLDPTRWNADNVLVNGSFERPVIASGRWQIFTTAGQGLTGWTVDANTADTQSGQADFLFTGIPDGKQVLDLNNGAISQIVATTENYKYRVSFSLSKNYICASGSVKVRVAFGVTTREFTFTAGGSAQSMVWDARTFEAVSSGTSSTLRFTALTFGDCGGPMLDAVSVESIGPADITAPVITPTVTGTFNGDWYTSDVDVTWTVDDVESEVSSSNGCDATSVTQDTDVVTFTCTATSAGGTDSESVTIKRDASAPVIAPTVTGTKSLGGWYTTNVIVSWSVVEGTSGIASSDGCSATTTTTDNSGTTYTCTVTNGAGLSATESVSAKRDATKPVITLNVVATMGLGGWYTSDVAVSWNVADGMSGIASSNNCGATTTTTDNAGTTYTCTATDNAGLSETKSVFAKRDATQPSIGYAGNAGSYTVDQTVAITCSVSDAMSGVASNTCANVSGAAYTFAIGANSFSAAAQDYAGNGNSASASFIVAVTSGSLCALVQRWVSNAGVANSMCVKLRQGSYGAFRNELSAQSGKKISAANAAILLQLVNLLD